MGSHAPDADLCLRELSRSLAKRIYTWHVNFKPGLVHNLEHPVSFLNTKLFYTEISSP